MPILLIALMSASLGASPATEMPSDFLKVQSKAWSRWLDGPVKTRWTEIPLEDVLAVFAAADLKIEGKTPLSTPVTFDASELTRRAALWQLGQKFGLRIGWTRKDEPRRFLGLLETESEERSINGIMVTTMTVVMGADYQRYQELKRSAGFKKEEYPDGSIYYSIVVDRDLNFGNVSAHVPEVQRYKTRAPRDVTFEMRPVSIFEKTASIAHLSYHLPSGQYVRCSTEPDPEVRAYPKLNSSKPFYGKVKFGEILEKPGTGLEYHFVLDESGETPAESKPSAKKPPDGKPAKKESAGVHSSAPSRSPSKASYDRLYFDVNRDLDLTNDPVLRPMKEPPAGCNPFASSADQSVVFDYLDVPLDYGPSLGTRPFRILPRMMIQEGRGSLSFVATTASQGQIRIGSEPYDAVLAQAYQIGGRFDLPGTFIFLTRPGQSQPIPFWWGGYFIKALRYVDGRYYSTVTTPLGDELTVKPYRGDLGTLKVVAGRRDLKKVSMVGSLDSGMVAVAVGEPTYQRQFEPKTVTQCNLPVGDYLARFLTVEYGRLRFNLSNNFHRDGRPRDKISQPDHLIKIRKDRPFVLDFSDPPEVLFASPARDETLATGDTLRVTAVLTIPALDVMIRRLEDTSRTQPPADDRSKREGPSSERPVSLEPTVTITNSSGKTVAEGKMPFG